MQRYFPRRDSVGNATVCGAFHGVGFAILHGVNFQNAIGTFSAVHGVRFHKMPLGCVFGLFLYPVESLSWGFISQSCHGLNIAA